MTILIDNFCVQMKSILDIDCEEDLLGQPWTYKIEIKQAVNLPLFCELAYVQYEFFGETFVTGDVITHNWIIYVSIHLISNLLII